MESPGLFGRVDSSAKSVIFVSQHLVGQELTVDIKQSECEYIFIMVHCHC